jgi:hypothetical protein
VTIKEPTPKDPLHIPLNESQRQNILGSRNSRRVDPILHDIKYSNETRTRRIQYQEPSPHPIIRGSLSHQSVKCKSVMKMRNFLYKSPDYARAKRHDTWHGHWHLALETSANICLLCPCLYGENSLAFDESLFIKPATSQESCWTGSLNDNGNGSERGVEAGEWYLLMRADIGWITHYAHTAHPMHFFIPAASASS